MADFDFKEFYEKQSDYAAFRNDPVKREEYNIAVNWKVNRLCSVIPEDLSFSDALEVGCALGILLNKVTNQLKISERTGIDISSENIKVASELFTDCRFIRGTVEDLIAEIKSSGGHRFSLTILSDIVEHIPDDIGFMKQVSEISDYVLLNLPLEKSFSTRKRKYGTEDPSGHLRSYDERDAVELVESAGFVIIRSISENARSNIEYNRLFATRRRERISKKRLDKKVFWNLFYFFDDQIMKIFPGLFVKLYGSNYFALLKSNRS